MWRPPYPTWSPASEPTSSCSTPWRILEAVSARVPFALAGGLTPENVGKAIQLTGAAIVDVSSGVESAPGEKDIGLIRRFLQASKGAKQSPDFNGPTGVEA
jgi:phosphoribosylanthranilate isomerase